MNHWKKILSAAIFTVAALSGGADDAAERGAWQFKTTDHPRIFIDNSEKQNFLEQLRTVPWMRDYYRKLKSGVAPAVERHAQDPDWIVSRLQMNWTPGQYHTRAWAAQNQILRREGNAPYPTVRLAYHRVGGPRTDWDKLRPYESEGLFLQKDGKTLFVPYPETRLEPENLNRRMISMAYDAAIVYFVENDERYAKFAADIFWVLVRGASYQEQLNSDDAKHNCFGFLSYETLGDSRRYAELPLIWDFLFGYFQNRYFISPEFTAGVSGSRWQLPQPGGARWANERVILMFQKYLDNKITRGGGIQGNWNLNEQQSAIFYALALPDDSAVGNGKGRNHYVKTLIDGPSSVGHGALRDVATGNLEPATGLWPEPPAGYGQGSIGQLAMAAVLYYRNGIDIFNRIPLLEKGVRSFPQMAFPNGLSTGWGDANYSRINATTAELMIGHARRTGDIEAERRMTSLVDPAAKRPLGGSSHAALFLFAPELPALAAAEPLPRVSYSPVLSLLMERNPGKTALDSPAFSLYGAGAKSGHRHRNGIAMELYGRGHVVGVDPGAGPDYWHRQHSQYNNQLAAHNTVIPNGMAMGNGPLDLRIVAAEPQPEPGRNPAVQLSPEIQFVEVAGDFSPKIEQRRMMALVRTGAQTGLVLDVFRSRMRDGSDRQHDYLYHNMGKSFTTDAPQSDAAWTADGGPGYGYFEFKGAHELTQKTLHGAFDFGSGEIATQVWAAPAPGRTLFVLSGSENFRYYLGNMRKWRVPAMLIRQTGEAWNRPFAVVYEVTGNGAKGDVADVRFDSSVPGVVRVEITTRDGSVRQLIQSDDPARPVRFPGVEFSGSFALIHRRDGKLQSLYLGGGTRLAVPEQTLESPVPANLATK